MKCKKSRLAVRRLFVLGAGASFSASQSPQGGAAITAPLDGQFAERIAALDLKRPQWVSGAKQRVLDGWKDQRASFKDTPLEDAVLRQLSHLEFIEAIHPRRKRGAVTGPEWLSDVAHLMCFVLRRARESSAAPYRTFVDRVFPADTSFDELEDRVVTFNYDDLMDRHIVARAGVERVYFDRIVASKAGSQHRAVRFPHPLVVKLHGSVNWRCTSDEFERIVGGTPKPGEVHRIGSIWYDEKGRPSPRDKGCPLIMPPLPAKPITSIEIFNYLWTKAYEYLHDAKHLIVCGYSLPPADRLAWSLFGNFKNSNLDEVTVVDPDPAVIAKWRELLDRRGVKRAKWTYYVDFTEFAQQLAA